MMPDPSPWRLLDAQGLERELLRMRRRTRGLIDAWRQARPDLSVPLWETLNPPLWEWGHVAWFQDWWIGRNRQRALGVQADPDHPRTPSAMSAADALYNSSTVPHASRWSLPLPGLQATLDELDRVLEQTLRCLRADAAIGSDLYFFHLVLAHEAMHNEASVYMAQALDVPVPAVWAEGRGSEAAVGRRSLHVPAHTIVLGHRGAGFCFDNELGAHEVSLPAFEIDDRPVGWGEYLPFLEATGRACPPHLRKTEGAWQVRRFGQWLALDPTEPADHLRAEDAQAWCDWAGRALPTEAQWEAAARTLGPSGAFRWGQVWEWTASRFEPYPGFRAHPYRDYSAPWFGTHRVLRGASRWTQDLMVCPSYRNFFLPHRQDVPAGFRTVGREG